MLSPETVDKKPKPRKIQVDVSWQTILKLLVAALAVYSIVKLAPLFMTLFFAVMLAVTLNPLLVILKKRGFPSWVGVAAVVSAFVGIALVGLLIIMPPLITQTGALVEALPKVRQALIDHLPANADLHAFGEKALGDLSAPRSADIMAPLLSVGAVAASGVTQILLIVIFTIYLLVDGTRTINWILAFFKADTRARLKETAEDISKVVSAYVAGQVITSIICGIYTFIVLTCLGVPSAMPLAVIAGVFDVLPVLGFFLAAIPAILLALSLSPFKALLVLALYVAYHGLENYLLVPRIYGARMRLSDLVVLTSLFAAAALAGTLGAIAVLPLVASYPIIERIWLKDFLGRSVVSKHAATAAINDA